MSLTYAVGMVMPILSPLCLSVLPRKLTGLGQSYIGEIPVRSLFSRSEFAKVLVSVHTSLALVTKDSCLLGKTQHAVAYSVTQAWAHARKQLRCRKSTQSNILTVTREEGREE